MFHKQLFKAEANRMRKEIMSVMPRWYRPSSFDEELNYGYEMYSNSYSASNAMFVLGDDKIRTDMDLLFNLGTTSVTPTQPARRAINSQEAERINSGSVLNEKYWWPFFNDCWVMGGVHGKHEFHLGHSDWPENKQLWDRNNSRPKMLGRELHILSVSGYSLRKSPLGMVFYNTNHMKAFNLRFSTIYALDAGSNENNFIELIKNAF